VLDLSPDKTLEQEVLLRVINTPAQSALDRKDRQDRRHAFAMEPLRQGAVSDKRIVLLDDVKTTPAALP